MPGAVAFGRDGETRRWAPPIALKRLARSALARPTRRGGVGRGGRHPAGVLDDGQLELRPRAPDAVGDELGLEAADEALRHPMSKASPTEPIDASTPWSSRTCVK